MSKKILTTFSLILQILSSKSTICPPYNPNITILLPHEYMCTWYYRCEQNGPILMECWPPGTHFSPNTNRCEWEAVANCTLSGVPPTTSTTVMSTTTTRNSPPTAPIDTTTTTQPTTMTTTTIFTIPTTTTKIPTTTTLPTTTTAIPTTTTSTTTIFIIPTAPTSPSFTIPTVPVGTTTTTRMTTTSTTTTRRPQPECPEIDDPNVLVFLPNVDDCGAYFLCFNGGKVARSCADGFYWDEGNNWCNVREEVDCGVRGRK